MYSDKTKGRNERGRCEILKTIELIKEGILKKFRMTNA